MTARNPTPNGRERRAAKKRGEATLLTVDWGGIRPRHAQGYTQAGMDRVMQQIRSTRGLSVRIADACGISRAAIYQWRRVPANRAHTVAELTGWPVERIRPDIFAPKKQYGSRAYCYVCGVAHKASNIVRIREDDGAAKYFAVCAPCFEAEDNNAVVRRYWGNPDLKIFDGGKATTEQLEAMVAKHNDDATEH